MTSITRPVLVGVALAVLLGPPTTFGNDATPVARARAAAERQDAAALLAALRDRYRDLDAITIEGETTMTTSVFGSETKRSTSFTARGARDGRYLVRWSMQPGPEAPGVPAQAGAIWNAGGKPSIYRGEPPAWAVEASDLAVISMATGISGRAAMIPLLVVPTVAEVEPMPDLMAPTFEGEEAVDGEPCWKITGASKTTDRETLWISKRRVVIRRRESPLIPSAKVMEQTDAAQRDPTDEDFAAMGIEPTPEARARMKQMAAAFKEMMAVMAKHGEAMQGVFVEDHRKVRLNPTSTDADYTFEVPPGTPKLDSFLSGMFQAAPPQLPASPPGSGNRGSQN